MQKKGANISLKGYDDIFSTDQSRAEAQQERVQEIPLSDLHPFEGHPFRVVDDEEMLKTAESVREFGVLTPAIVRPDPDGGYEIISGHRQHRASELAGKETMPVIVRDMDDDAAIILMVDANLQRETILPSERAFVYSMKMDAMRRTAGRPKLMARDDVASLVCATDAGREGELIFRLVYHKAGCRKPFERLWISSMEDSAIREGFENLRSGTEYDALYEAALCRERADWIVGINATRLFSTLYGQTLNVGRVMTPTLAMAVMREAAIAAFKPEPFYTVRIALDGFTAASENLLSKALHRRYAPAEHGNCRGG